MHNVFGWLTLAAAALSAACDPSATSSPLPLDATGVVVGLAFVDRNGNGRIDPNVDAPAPGLRVSIAPGSSLASVAAVRVSDGSGLFSPAPVPVGTYRVLVESAGLGDTLELAEAAVPRITVAAGDTVEVAVALRYSSFPIARTRDLRVGRTVAVSGIVLNSWGTFGDSTIHLRDSSGSIRLVSARPVGMAVGDSVRVLARVDRRAAGAVLSDPAFFTLSSAPAAAAPQAVTMRRGRTADGGELDAALVRVVGTVIRDPLPGSGGDPQLFVGDSSGTIQVVLDADARIAPAPPLRVGAEVTLTGLLLPGPGREWLLKPRSADDVRVEYGVTTVADARRAPTRFMRVRGVALNAGAALAGGAVHVRDVSGSIRIFPVARSPVVAGDTIDVHGEVAVLGDGQPALVGAAISLRAPGPESEPVAASSGSAARAEGGRLDGELVRIRDAVVSDTASRGGERLLSVNDGSGLITVVVGVAVTVDPAALLIGTTLDLVGLLVPDAAGIWALRPRSALDLTAR